MANAGEAPVANTPAAAKRALEEDLPVVLRGGTVEDAGWTRVDDLTLLVPVEGVRESGASDPYLVRLHFGYYPEWPPSTLFVNPSTGRYQYPDDVPWLPSVEGNSEFKVHAAYRQVGQLVCASVTLEFYTVLHSVKPEHVWDPEKQNFAATLNTIQGALTGPHYQGPQKPRVGS